VVTIIVLLILATVTMNMVLRDEGILSLAGKSSAEFKKAQYFEEINLEIADELAQRKAQPKEEPLSVSLKNRIEKLEWVSEAEIYVEAGQTEITGNTRKVIARDGVNRQAPLEERIIILLNTEDSYEMAVQVNDKGSGAELIEEHFEKVGEKPTILGEILTEGIVEEGTVEIKITAGLTEGSIEIIEATNGAVLKTDTSTTEKVFEVSKNGTYYFKAKAAFSQSFFWESY